MHPAHFNLFAYSTLRLQDVYGHLFESIKVLLSECYQLILNRPSVVLMREWMIISIL